MCVGGRPSVLSQVASAVASALFKRRRDLESAHESVDRARPMRTDARRGTNLPQASHGGLLREDAEEQQCLVVLLHAVPFDFTHDQLPELREWLAGVVS